MMPNHAKNFIHIDYLLGNKNKIITTKIIQKLIRINERDLQQYLPTKTRRFYIKGLRKERLKKKNLHNLKILYISVN